VATSTQFAATALYINWSPPSTIDYQTDNPPVTHLVILWRQLVQTLLNDVIPIQVLDEHHNVHAERDND
jgi:hypothetical protein